MDCSTRNEYKAGLHDWAFFSFPVTVMGYEDYLIGEVGQLCQTIWEIVRLVTFDGKLTSVPCNQPQSFPMPYNVPPNYTPPPRYGSPYPYPYFRQHGQFNW